MRFKIGDTWYENDQPLMVELTQKDRENIANMHSDATKYACFPIAIGREAAEDWMES